MIPPKPKNTIETMDAAIRETNRRREIQQKYNEENGITPRTVKKDIGELIKIGTTGSKRGKSDKKKLSEADRIAEIERLREEMKKAARELRFEEAAYLRDKIKALEIVKK